MKRYVTQAQFDAYQKNEVPNILSVLHQKVNSPALKMEIAARGLGWNSYGQLKPLLDREALIRKGMVLEAVKTQHESLYVIRYRDIILALNRDNSSLRGYYLDSSYDIFEIAISPYETDPTIMCGSGAYPSFTDFDDRKDEEFIISPQTVTSTIVTFDLKSTTNKWWGKKEQANETILIEMSGHDLIISRFEKGNCSNNFRIISPHLNDKKDFIISKSLSNWGEVQGINIPDVVSLKNHENVTIMPSVSKNEKEELANLITQLKGHGFNPSIYIRGNVHRAHLNIADNAWSESQSPLEALSQAYREHLKQSCLTWVSNPTHKHEKKLGRVYGSKS